MTKLTWTKAEPEPNQWYASLGNTDYAITEVSGFKGIVFVVQVDGVAVNHCDSLEAAKAYVEGTLA